MPWHPDFPLGTTSVRNNRVIGDDNTKYIQTTMGNEAVGTNTVATRDHFWNVGPDQDGRHRFIQSPKFVSPVGVNTDPLLGTLMDGVLYLRTVSTDVGRVEGFYRNAEGIYQYIPSFLQGAVAVPSTASFSLVTTIPPNVYGEILMYTTAMGQYSAFRGHFRSNATVVEGWSLGESSIGLGTYYPLKLANGADAINLDLKARRSDAASATWNYRITYRAL